MSDLLPGEIAHLREAFKVGGKNRRVSDNLVGQLPGPCRHVGQVSLSAQSFPV
jgi:hypothetical protein